MKKRFFSILLVLAMCLRMLPVTAHAAVDDLVSYGSEIIQDFVLDDISYCRLGHCCFDGYVKSSSRYPLPSGKLVFKLPGWSEIRRLDLYLWDKSLKSMSIIRDYNFKVLDMDLEEFERKSVTEKTEIINNPAYWKTLCTVTGNTQAFRSHPIDMGYMSGGQIFMLEVTKAGSDGWLNILEVELYGTPHGFEDPYDHSMPGYRVDWSEDFDVRFNGPIPEGWSFEDKLGKGAECRFYAADTENGDCNYYWVHHGTNSIHFATKEPTASTWLYSPSVHVGEGYKMSFSLVGGSLLGEWRAGLDYRDNTEYCKVYAIEEGKEPVQLGRTYVTQTYWKNFVVDLSDYAGKDIRLAFVHSGPTCVNYGVKREAGINIDCFKVWKPLPSSANVIFKVLNGTWDGTDSSDKIVTVPLENGMGTLRADQIPTGMVPNQGYGQGSWIVQPNTRENAIQDDTSYIFTFEPLPKSPFVDVHQNNYYFQPVLWAVNHNITKGLDAIHFGPNASCTRAQVVTFLWNAANRPNPTSMNNPFEDVSASSYYYRAVLWAVERGITKGLDAAHFGPNANCTRAQVAAFLWNASNHPQPTSTENPFVDVSSDKYYYRAVLWAAEHDITKGVDNVHFSPNADCTRAQVVTFLWNANGKSAV